MPAITSMSHLAAVYFDKLSNGNCVVMYGNDHCTVSCKLCGSISAIPRHVTSSILDSEVEDNPALTITILSTGKILRQGAKPSMRQG